MNIFKKLILRLKEFKHQFFLFKWLTKKPKTNLDFLGQAFLSITARWKTEIEPLLTYIVLFDKLRQEKFSGDFIEFGGGYSTILLPVMLKNKVNLTSVDINPNKYIRILNSSFNRDSFTSSLNILKEVCRSEDIIKI